MPIPLPNLSIEAVWKIEGLTEMLSGADTKLEEVQKGLNQYLESKQGFKRTLPSFLLPL